MLGRCSQGRLSCFPHPGSDANRLDQILGQVSGRSLEESLRTLSDGRGSFGFFRALPGSACVVLWLSFPRHVGTWLGTAVNEEARLIDPFYK